MLNTTANDYTGGGGGQMTGPLDNSTVSPAGAMSNTSPSSWISSHHAAHGMSMASKIPASSHWSHSAAAGAAANAACMTNTSSMLDSGNGFQTAPNPGHLPPQTADPFGFGAHVNDLTKSSFYYASQFGSGIRGLTL